MANKITTIIYNSEVKEYAVYDSMAAAARFLGFSPTSFKMFINGKGRSKGYWATTEIPEDWFIRKGYRKVNPKVDSKPVRIINLTTGEVIENKPLYCDRLVN